jgi:L-lactate dehydrogenase complex protein LldE
MRVALFVTCLIDLYRPNVGFAAVKLLEAAGCKVDVPLTQTCCGQPAYNNGDRADTKIIARQVIETFEGYEHVVVPSGSCGGMLKIHYPELFADESEWLPRAQRFAARVYELTSFLTDIIGVERLAARYSGRVTYHDSCSSLREMGVSAAQAPGPHRGDRAHRAAQPRGLLRLRRHLLRQVSRDLRAHGRGQGRYRQGHRGRHLARRGHGV